MQRPKAEIVQRVRVLLFKAAQQDAEGQRIFESLIHNNSEEGAKTPSDLLKASSPHACLEEDDIERSHPPIILCKSHNKATTPKRRHSTIDKHTEF